MYKEFETEAAFEKEIDLHVKNAVRAAEDKIKKSKDEEISTIKDQLKLHENKIKELTQKLEEVEKERDEALIRGNVFPYCIWRKFDIGGTTYQLPRRLIGVN